MLGARRRLAAAGEHAVLGDRGGCVQLLHERAVALPVQQLLRQGRDRQMAWAPQVGKRGRASGAVPLKPGWPLWSPHARAARFPGLGSLHTQAAPSTGRSTPSGARAASSWKAANG